MRPRPAVLRMPPLLTVTALLLVLPSMLLAATPGLTGAAEQTLADYSVSRYRGARESGPISVIVRPFDTDEVFKNENIGALAAEIVIRHLRGLRKLQVVSEEAAEHLMKESARHANEPALYTNKVLMSGTVRRHDDRYDITMQLTDPARDRELTVREISVPVGDFHRMLARYLKWKHRTWAVQPYLQALYSERYLADGFPPRMISISRLGVDYSVLIEPARLAIDETAEFTGGLRLTYRKRMTLDLAYTGHGHSTSEGQYLVTMTGSTTPVSRSRMLMYVSTSAFSTALCGTARLYGDLYGYAGAGWEGTTAAQTVSSMSRLWFSGPEGSTEVRSYFLSPQGPMEKGGVLKDFCSLPFIRAGFEWRPNRLGFNLLVTYRLGDGDFKPLKIAVEELNRAGGSEPQLVSYTTMDVTRYRLPRLSLGAAFTLSL